MPHCAAAAVRIAEAVAGRGRRKADEVGRCKEITVAFRLRAPARKSLLHRSLQHDLERSAIPPVIISFRISSASICHICQFIGFQGFVKHGPTEIRIILPHCQRTEDHAGIAYGIPVVAYPVKPCVSIIQRSFQALVHDGARNDGALVHSHARVKPVIAYGQRHRHLGVVKEM